MVVCVRGLDCLDWMVRRGRMVTEACGTKAEFGLAYALLSRTRWRFGRIHNFLYCGIREPIMHKSLAFKVPFLKDPFPCDLTAKAP